MECLHVRSCVCPSVLRPCVVWAPTLRAEYVPSGAARARGRTMQPMRRPDGLWPARPRVAPPSVQWTYSVVWVWPGSWWSQLPRPRLRMCSASRWKGLAVFAQHQCSMGPRNGRSLCGDLHQIATPRARSVRTTLCCSTVRQATVQEAHRASSTRWTSSLGVRGRERRSGHQALRAAPERARGSKLRVA